MQTDRPLIEVDWRNLTIRREGTTVILTEEPDARVRDAWGDEISLAEGMHVWLYQPETNEAGTRDDLVLEGQAHFEADRDGWIVAVENQRIRRRSEIQPNEDHWANWLAWDRLMEHEELARRARRSWTVVSRLGRALSRRKRGSGRAADAVASLSDPPRLQPRWEFWPAIESQFGV
jgi:hypothetical protein